MHAALLFHSDAFILGDAQIMGRRMAGAAFLRAAVEGLDGGTLTAFTPLAASADKFRVAVAGIDPAAKTAWIPGHRLDELARLGMLFRPDADLGAPARLRLRAGPAAFGITGITHTISTNGAMAALADIVSSPVMPWDALICTSTSARAAVDVVLDQAAAYHRWMGRADGPAGRPQLPVIPLGVHCADFAATVDSRAAARASFGLAADEVAFLFAGRLSATAKAHPFQMFQALQTVAERSGRRLVLIQAGQFANPTIEAWYRQAVIDHCPAVRCIFADGGDDDRYAAGFAAADIFISLSDNIQESFGLTVVEAMAAGLPVVVSDWDGYKDTVRDGVDGFRIACWAPAPGQGGHLAVLHEAGVHGPPMYQAQTCVAVSVDMAQLVDRIARLAGDADLRRSMGDAGSARARADYDWSHIYRRYRDLWTELDAVRHAAVKDPAMRAWLAAAPRGQAAYPDPYRMFAAHPTAHIGPETGVRLMPAADIRAYAAISAEGGFHAARMPADRVAPLLERLAAGPASVGDLATLLAIPQHQAIEMVARLAKMNLVALADRADTP